MKQYDYLKLSKEVSYALRHAPRKYELELDDEGWVSIEQLLFSLRKKRQWPNIQEEELIKMIALSKKKRHEIEKGKIRAYYGHSLSKKIRSEKQIPPKILYHGTTSKSMNSILVEGLRPCERQYVHLSEDLETAIEVGKRREKEPVILVVNAQQASDDGIRFYYGNEKIWLADFIPANYIDLIKCYGACAVCGFRDKDFVQRKLDTFGRGD